MEIQSSSWINSWPLPLIQDEPKPHSHIKLCLGQLGMELHTKSPVALFLSFRQRHSVLVWAYFFPLKAAESCGADFFYLLRTKTSACCINLHYSL